jgi:spore coat protein SA
MYRSNFGKWRWAEAGASRLASVLPDENSTIVICTLPEAVLASRRALPNARIVHWLHTPVGSEFLSAALTADATVVPSRAVFYDTWRRSGNQYPAPLWLISNWIDTEAFEPPSPEQRRNARCALGLTEEDGVVAFVGRHWIKGSRIVERALAALPSRRERIVLLSAGESQVRRVVLAPGRELWSLGLVPPGELAHLYSAADLGVVPSVSEENMPLAALEMMATGLPIVASRVGGLPEVLEDGVTGRLVDIPNEVDAWAAAISDLLSDAESRLTYGEAARTTVLQRHTFERAQNAWTRVLTQLAE